VGTDLKPGANAGFAGVLDGFPQKIGIHFQSFHFLIICFAARVRQKGGDAFGSVNGFFIA